MADTSTAVKLPALMEKKEMAQTRQNFDLHVLLIMRQTGATKSVAAVQAYRETSAGLSARLG